MKQKYFSEYNITKPNTIHVNVVDIDLKTLAETEVVIEDQKILNNVRVILSSPLEEMEYQLII